MKVCGQSCGCKTEKECQFSNITIMEPMTQEERINSPVFFGRWLLHTCQPKCDSQGFLGWQYGPFMFDELPPNVSKSPDDVYTTHEVYEIFKAQHTPTNK